MRLEASRAAPSESRRFSFFFFYRARTRRKTHPGTLLSLCSRLPGLVEDYLEGKLTVDDYVTHSVRPLPSRFPTWIAPNSLGFLAQTSLDEISKGFDYMHQGSCIRCVVDMWA